MGRMHRLRGGYGRARPWVPLVLGAAVFLAVSLAIGVTEIERASKGPAFRVSAACLRLNATVRQELGVVTGFGFTVTGPVVQNADGTGNARLDFTAHGSWRNGHVHIKAIERRRRWYLVGPAELYVSGVRAPFRVNPDHLELVPGSARDRYTLRCAPTTSTTTFPRG
jgi:Cytochrome oxidase complex assembly protein 1